MEVNKLEIYYKQLNEIRKKRENLQFALIYRNNFLGTNRNTWEVMDRIGNYVANFNYDRYVKKEGRLERKIAVLSNKRK